jgi:hypothetical protein
LFLQPFDQIQRVNTVAVLKHAGVGAEENRREGELEERGNACHHDCGFPPSLYFGAASWIAAGGLISERDERFKAVADRVSVRQFAVVRENIPPWVKQWSRVESRTRIRSPTFDFFWPSTLGSQLSTLHRQPRRDVLFKTFLRLQIPGDDNNGSMGKKFAEQHGEKWLGTPGDAGAGQHSAILHALREGSHSGSPRDSGEQFACRRDWRILRQARPTSQSARPPSSLAGLQSGRRRAPLNLFLTVVLQQCGQLCRRILITMNFRGHGCPRSAKAVLEYLLLKVISWQKAT